MFPPLAGDLDLVMGRLRAVDAGGRRGLQSSSLRLAGGASSRDERDTIGRRRLSHLMGDEDGVLYFENTGTSTAAVFVQKTGGANPFDGIAVDSNNPAIADLDGDNDLDLIVGNNYFENTGTSTAPAFVQRTGDANPLSGIETDHDSTAALGDLDGDGDLDLAVGDGDGVLTYIENTGSSTAPAFVQRTGGANLFAGIDVGYNSAPAFADVDGDGDLDLVVGEEDGVLNYLENTGTSTAPVFVERAGSENPFDHIVVGIGIEEYSAPVFADLDGDGDLDLLVSEWNGLLTYFENDGPSTTPVFVPRTRSANPFDDIDVGERSVPAFVDLDGDGTLIQRPSIDKLRPHVTFLAQAIWTSLWAITMAISHTWRTLGHLRHPRSWNGL